MLESILCSCQEPDIEKIGSTIGLVCQKCFNPMGYKTVDQVLQQMNEEFYRKHQESFIKNSSVVNKPDFKEKDGSIPQELIDDADRFANNLDEKEVEKATAIEEKRSYLAWVQKNIGSLTPKMYIYTAVSAVVIFAIAKLKGC